MNLIVGKPDSVPTYNEFIGDLVIFSNRVRLLVRIIGFLLENK